MGGSAHRSAGDPPRLRRGAAGIVAALASGLLAGGTGAGTAAATAGTLVEYPVRAGAAPTELVLSATGNAVQFPEPGSGTLGVVTEKGRYGRRILPLATGRPTGVAFGADGALWITLSGAATVERWAAGRVHRFALPRGSAPSGIAAGPAGLWICEPGTNRIARLTLAGSLRQFAVPTPHAGLSRITIGSDGHVWFTERTAGRIGRLDPVTGAVVERRLAAGALPSGIATGPDGALWVAESGLGRVAVIDPATLRVTATYPAGLRPVGVAAGVDDAVWVTDAGGNAVIRLAADGSPTVVPVPTPRAGLAGITTGPRGDVWFAERTADRIGRIEVGVAHTQYTTVRAAVTVPAPPRLQVGSRMQWTFFGPGVQSIADASGLGLYASGTRSFVSTFAYTFGAAGDFPFRSRTSAQAGVVKVLPRAVAQPAVAPARIAVTWATAAAAPGFAYDVDVRAPGSPAFVPWRSAVSEPQGDFAASDPGTYRFRARLLSTASGSVVRSGWSPAVDVTLG